MYKKLYSYIAKNIFKSSSVNVLFVEFSISLIEINLDDLPYIGLIRKGLYVATGFNMWGMTNSILSAYILTNLITNGKSKYSELFNPNRKMLIKPMLNNLCNSVKNLLCFKTPRCPHLGSKLIYNEKEKIYECPCHGSKFHENGKLINGPSKNNLR